MTHTTSTARDAARASSTPTPVTAQLLAALVAGCLFGFGLAFSTMIRPEVVLGFLRVQDMGLMLVLGGAVVVTFIGYRFAPRLLRQPLLGGRFGAHESSMSRSTIVGAAIFGVGWGLTGVCPGPAIAGLGAGAWELLFSIAGIALGALLQGVVSDRTSKAGTSR